MRLHRCVKSCRWSPREIHESHGYWTQIISPRWHLTNAQHWPEALLELKQLEGGEQAPVLRLGWAACTRGSFCPAVKLMELMVMMGFSPAPSSFLCLRSLFTSWILQSPASTAKPWELSRWFLSGGVWCFMEADVWVSRETQGGTRCKITLIVPLPLTGLTENQKQL